MSWCPVEFWGKRWDVERGRASRVYVWLGKRAALHGGSFTTPAFIISSPVYRPGLGLDGPCEGVADGWVII